MGAEDEKPKRSFLMKAATCVLGASVTLFGLGAAAYAARGGSTSKPDNMKLVEFILYGGNNRNI